jgi:heme/copper-type cytochrome/quinol oxidase subunit 1
LPLLSAWAVRAALSWLFIGALAGALIPMRASLGHPEWSAWIPAHAEVMLVGWMMQLAFGVAHWILPRHPRGAARGAPIPVLLVISALNLGVVLVVVGVMVTGRALEAGAAIGFAVQGVPRIRTTGWGATGQEGDLVRLKKRVEMV